MVANICGENSDEALPMPMIQWWRTSFGNEEVHEITQAIRNEHISQGPVVNEFENRLREYLEVPYVVATTSGSTSLLMALMAIGVGPGDEVIVPNRTWIATAHAPVLLGAKVRLVDVEAGRPTIDSGRIEEAITSQTKAIIPVHLNGRAADMREIRRIALKYGVRVIEDAAQALGSRNMDGLLGTQSDMGCFSLSVAKIIATGQGGFIATRDRVLYEKLVSIRTHGVDSVVDAQWTKPGFNFRFADILASIGIAQLRQLAERIEKVKAIYSRYAEGICGLHFLKLVPVNIGAGEIPIYIEILCNERERLIDFLASRGIQARPFYPDLNLASYLHNGERFPNSEKFGLQGIFLPSGPAQLMENIDKVIDTLKKFPY
ncbi:MAG: DegT/DnrJ/EryC1/StrS family aminotransferase [Gallionella sp.]|nr:DegT/DnrJ/EryC1/StrS family aminotransferase [Gallionella sp.]